MQQGVIPVRGLRYASATPSLHEAPEREEPKNYLCYNNMTKKYNQLTLEQRYKIEALKGTGTTQTQIAEIIGVHKNTISREFRRNIPRSGINADKYIAIRADEETR